MALVVLATKLWQHKCQSPAEPLSLLGLGFQQWKHLVRPAWICEHEHCEASKSNCCSVQPIALHNDKPQILHPAFRRASVGQHHIYDLVQEVAGNVMCHSQGHCVHNWRDHKPVANMENKQCTLGLALPGKHASQDIQEKGDGGVWRLIVQVTEKASDKHREVIQTPTMP